MCITTLPIYDKILAFLHQKMQFQNILVLNYDR